MSRFAVLRGDHPFVLAPRMAAVEEGGVEEVRALELTALELRSLMATTGTIGTIGTKCKRFRTEG